MNWLSKLLKRKDIPKNSLDFPRDFQGERLKPLNLKELSRLRGKRLTLDTGKLSQERYVEFQIKPNAFWRADGFTFFYKPTEEQGGKDSFLTFNVHPADHTPDKSRNFFTENYSASQEIINSLARYPNVLCEKNNGTYCLFSKKNSEGLLFYGKNSQDYGQLKNEWNQDILKF